MFDKDLVHESGSIPGAGLYKCVLCGEEISLKDGEALPVCPKCKIEKFQRIA